MTAYAIGDVQGCYKELRNLCDRIDFEPVKDELWFTGDLVNRGPESLQVLRFVRSLGPAARVVLGNHDLHLLSVSLGLSEQSTSDTLNPVLNAPDRDELLDWLRRQPLLHYDIDRNLCMLHAGLPPQWDLMQARNCAQEIESLLQGDDYPGALRHIVSPSPTRWTHGLQGKERISFIASCFTRLRYCTEDGGLNLKEKGPPETQPDLIPWFQFPKPRWHGVRFIVGHWAALGVYLSRKVIALDSGCVWGGQLTAANLDHDFELECVHCGDQDPV